MPVTYITISKINLDQSHYHTTFSMQLKKFHHTLNFMQMRSTAINEKLNVTKFQTVVLFCSVNFNSIQLSSQSSVFESKKSR